MLEGNLLGSAAATKGNTWMYQLLVIRKRKNCFTVLRHILILGKLNLSFAMYYVLMGLSLSSVAYFLIKTLPQNASKSLLFACSLSTKVLTLALRYSLEFSLLDQGEKLGTFFISQYNSSMILG